MQYPALLQVMQRHSMVHYRTVLWMRQLVGVLGWQRHGLRCWFWQQGHRNKLRHPESVRLAQSVR